MDAYEYWQAIAIRSQAGIDAACEAAGAAGYLLGPYCQLSETQRLHQLRDVIADLRVALNLDPLPEDQQQNGRES